MNYKFQVIKGHHSTRLVRSKKYDYRKGCRYFAVPINGSAQLW